MKLLRLIAAALVLVSGVAVCHAQQPVFRAQVEVVRVDVSVLHKGQPVRGLVPSDFDLRDNGVKQSVTSVELEVTPIDVLLLLDSSTSVAGDRLNRLRDAATRLLGGLRNGDRASLMTFGHRITLKQPMTGDLAAVTRAVSSIQGNGSTALHDALLTAALTAHEPGRRFVVVVFSDGLDTVSWLTTKQVLDAMRRTDVIVYTVAELFDPMPRAFGPIDNAKRFLTSLTADSGGKVWWVPDPSQFGTAFAQVLRDLTTRYVLTYEPQGVDAAEWHTLSVKLTRQAGDVTARAGYYRR